MVVSKQICSFIGPTILIKCFLIVIAMISSTSSARKSAKEVQLNLTFDNSIGSKIDVMKHNKVVVCYLGSWATYRPDEGSYDLIESFKPELCTHLIYSFAGLDNVTNEFKPLDAYLDLEDDYGRGWYKQANLLKKRNTHLKVLLAVGGWNEGSIKYSKMAEEKKSRQTFIKSAIELLKKYGFDGLDLDWEFPGSRGGRKEDKDHFTILVKELRTALDFYGYMLTAAFGASQTIAESAYELPELSKMLDHIHLMCYDYHGSWDNKTYHNAPLYTTLSDKSVQFSVDYFIQQGVDPKKLVLGLPLYGRTFLLEDAEKEGDGLLDIALDKGFQGPYTREDGFLGYNEICKKLASDRGDWKTYWDSNARVPYMRNGAKWISFDNPDSLMEKVAFAVSRGLKGAMVWSIDTDDFRGTCGGSQNPLLLAINFALAEKSAGSATDKPDTKKRPTGSQAASPVTFSIFMLSVSTISTILLILSYTF